MIFLPAVDQTQIGKDKSESASCKQVEKKNKSEKLYKKFLIVNYCAIFTQSLKPRQQQKYKILKSENAKTFQVQKKTRNRKKLRQSHFKVLH